MNEAPHLGLTSFIFAMISVAAVAVDDDDDADADDVQQTRTCCGVVGGGGSV